MTKKKHVRMQQLVDYVVAEIVESQVFLILTSLVEEVKTPKN